MRWGLDVNIEARRAITYRNPDAARRISGNAVTVAGSRTGYASCGGHVGSPHFQRM
jgi:hypothetical protein